MNNKFTKQEKSWILYDWANSSYATIVLAAVFPIYFTQVCQAGNVSGDFWWGVGSSIATAIIAICAPILGAIGDYKGMKKKLLTSFLVVGLAATFLCAIVDSWQLMLVGYIISYIGFAGSNLFYDGLLTDVTTDEKMDKVSAWGFSMGYIGGSTIPFIASILLISFGGNFGINGTWAVKISLIITVLWWLVFSIPMLKNCNQRYGTDVPAKNLIKQALLSLKTTLFDIVKNKGLFMFLVAYFFYIDGVNTVIKMATAYGSTLNLDSTGMICALLVTQLVAFPCSILFSKFSTKFGTINILLISVFMYLIICATAFIMGFGTEQGFLTLGQALLLFWVLSVLVGTVQGGIQALSRSYYGRIIPKNKANEYFGLYDIFGKFSCVLGPAIYACVKGITGRSSFAILAIVILFFVAGVILIVGEKEFVKTEQAAKQARNEEIEV